MAIEVTDEQIKRAKEYIDRVHVSSVESEVAAIIAFRKNEFDKAVDLEKANREYEAEKRACRRLVEILGLEEVVYGS